MHGVLSSLVGGAFIGIAAAGLLFTHGQIAGITGIVGGLVRPGTSDRSWRALFVAGLFAGGFALAIAHPTALAAPGASPATLVAAGLLVGFGARLGGGCTSGHGVCGVGRLSLRSLAATSIFIVAGALAVFFTGHGRGGL